MECPNCANHNFERLDIAIVRCTNCYSLFDPYVYPSFPEPKGDVGELWDTSEDDFDDWEVET